MPTTEQLSSTLERIYAASADPALWEDALCAIENFTGCTGAVLDLVPKESTTAPQTFAGSFSRDDCTTYALNYMAHCPRIAFALANPAIRIHYDKRVLSEPEMDRDPVYEWFGKHGLRYYVAGWVGNGQLFNAYLSLQRSHSQGHVQQAEVENFALIQRHVEQAITLALRLGTLEQQCRFGLRLLDAVPQAIFALDGSGRIVLMNAPAEQLLESGDGLLTDNGRLACRLPSQQPLLDRLIGSALTADVEAVRGGWVRLHRASGRRPYLALVSQFAGGEELMDELRPKLLVIVSDPDRAVAPDGQALRDLYGLTDAEARVAVALASGHSVQSAAEWLGISAETLRSHLKHVFRKLGVARQQDLVRILTEIGLVVREAPVVAKRAHPNGG